MSALKKQEQEAREFVFTRDDFVRIKSLIYRHAGISLSDAKTDMVYSRIGRRLRALGMSSFRQYLDALEQQNHAEEWQAFTNALTTNLTSFFREEHHFPILAEHLAKLAAQKPGKPIRIWCSAASTGEEPYSIAITACEAFNSLKPPVEIIATDIDTNVLATATAGVYPIDRVKKMDESRVRKFFEKGTGKHDGLVRLKKPVRELINFNQLNLLDQQWPFREAFDVIFCRNVMIYFDKPTQSTIIDKFISLMHEDSLLLAGHSENFLYVSDHLQLLGKTVYKLKTGGAARSSLFMNRNLA
ncbi:MCP methyltransferase, CheR-type [Methylophilus rhizosphaerae]|uniref:Chemotaxis protein methyltransferase n=1 Tax=Methylophilus rhizosphaerae TaxID=492660 RepID=A0A1G9FAT8_9PROT|nr:CheR family methyltransferase [Methylophilus rhizosphaerae]SDK85519.1 MCP methyltransferase, CheR-type [Methylophilus rhizosphaerae]